MYGVDWYLEELLDVASADSITHYGKAHDENPPGPGSGRYPWGTGNRQHQHDWDLYNRIKKYKDLNPDLSESQIAAHFGFYTLDSKGNPVIDPKTGEPKGNINRLRAEYSVASQNRRKDIYAEFKWYDESINPETGEHYTDTQIARMMSNDEKTYNESSIRAMRKTIDNNKVNKVTEVANELEEQSKKLGYIDIGKGVEYTLGTSADGLNTAVEMLKKKGYTVQNAYLRQVQDPSRNTPYVVLCPPGSENDPPIWKHPEDIKRIADPSDKDNDISIMNAERGIGDPPLVSLDRIKIRYDEQGGRDRDGMVQIRAVRDENGNLVAASPDLSLGNAKYAQVRIGVEGNRYIKGMAVYDEDLPKGTDIVVNSNKSEAQGVNKALKPMEMDANDNTKLAKNPFGTTIVPTVVRDKDGNATDVRSAINFVGATKDDAHVEGRFGDYSKNLPSQFLSKQGLPLVKQQLKLDSQTREDRLADIESINNPLVKRRALIDFADECDRAAVDLKAAPIAGQKYAVLLSVPSLKNTEVFYPNLPTGTTVALVRFPHEGPFEIPICTVNNNNKEAKSFMDRAKDAIGVNPHTASELSGADFDGDTCIVIPMTKKNADGEFVSSVKIKGIGTGAPKLPHLDGFDPTASYGIDNPRFSSMKAVGPDGKEHPTYAYFKTTKAKGIEMGKITNLITDMYVKGCNDPDELSRATRYAMVVIDAQKHELNYKAAKEDLKINELYKKYQDNPGGKPGASTLISRASAEKDVPARQEWSADRAGAINPITGEKVYTPPKRTTVDAPYVEKVEAPSDYRYKGRRSKYLRNPDGSYVEATWDGEVKKNEDGSYYYDRGSGKTKWGHKEVARTTKTTRMGDAKNAEELYSRDKTEVEQAYAAYANHMKTLANQARLAAISPSLRQVKSPEAAKKYSKEVKELKDALVEAQKNSPRERQAQLLATSLVNSIVDTNPEYYKEPDHKKKLKAQELDYARKQTGAGKNRIKFTEKQWEAINAGAVSDSMLQSLLANADKDSYMSLALPKTNKISDAKQARIKSLYKAGWTQEEIADAVGVSSSTVSNIVK